MRPVRPTAAWRAGDTLVLACPSSRGGQYLVRVEKGDNFIRVVHSCPATVHGNKCWHIEAAAAVFKEYCWWERLEHLPVNAVARPVLFNPSIIEIPVPGTELEEVFQLEQHPA